LVFKCAARVNTAHSSPANLGGQAKSGPACPFFLWVRCAGVLPILLLSATATHEGFADLLDINEKTIHRLPLCLSWPGGLGTTRRAAAESTAG
jgi:hypothetical protein